MAGDDFFDLALGSPLGDNPFNILRATVRSTRAEIIGLAEDRMAFLDEQLVRQAQHDLTHPRRRLRAELGWLPGLPLDAASTSLRLAKKRQIPWHPDEIPPLPRANLLQHAIDDATQRNDRQWMSFRLGAFCNAIDRINLGDVRTAVDSDRAVAGFSAVDEMQLVSDFLDQRTRYTKISSRYLQMLKDSQQNQVLLEVLTQAKSAISCIHEVVDLFVLENKNRVDIVDQDIRSVVASLQTNIEQRALKIARLSTLLQDYGNLTSSTSLSLALRGLRNESAISVFSQVRSLNVDLVNTHGLIEEAQKIQIQLREAFLHIPELQAEIVRDQAALTRLHQQRAKTTYTTSPVAPSRSPFPASLAGSSTIKSPPVIITSDKKSGFRSSIWAKVAAVVLILAFIGNVIGNDEPDTSSSSKADRPTTTTRGSGVGRTTSSGAACSGIDSWWESTNDRVDQSNRLLMSLDATSPSYEYYSVQQQILSLAAEQRSSRAPSAAVLYSDARADMLEFLAQSLTDESMNRFARDFEFSAIQERTEMEAQRVGASCDFEVTFD